jgi:beta-mannanase
MPSLRSRWTSGAFASCSFDCDSWHEADGVDEAKASTQSGTGKVYAEPTKQTAAAQPSLSISLAILITGTGG